MARKPKRDDDASTEPVTTRLESELLKQLDAFRESLTFPPARSTVIARAICELLQRQGFWPPKNQ